MPQKLSDLTSLPQSDPALILRYRDRQFAAELIATALLRFDLFSWLKSNGPTDFDAVCEQFQWKSRPADVLLTLCRASGFLQNNADGQIELSPVGNEYLIQNSIHSLIPYYAPIADSPVVDGFASVLQTGRPAHWQAKEDGADWHDSMHDPEFAKSFTQLMNCRGVTFGKVLADKLKDWVRDKNQVVDLGGGSGIYTSTLLAKYPNLTGIILEQPPVDALATEELERWGLQNRAKVVSGDLFSDPIPRDADLFLLSNVLHDWDFPQVEQLLQRVSDAMTQNDVLILHEAFIDDDKSGPLPVAEYSALLMYITQGKCYSRKEYAQILEPLGFECSPLELTTADRGFFAAKKID